MADQERSEIERLFAEAATLPPAERAAYLDAHCSNLQVRGEVEKLLQYDALQNRGLTSFTGQPEKHPTLTEPGQLSARPGDALIGSHGQFLPGTILAERYRIISLLGKGGMGEVYRADDLVLQEPVALKILPRELDGRQSLLDALRNEVKQARQVSHRHVCRVHDIGEIDGRTFFSMEFIEGENLASLLHRIGRLPLAKSNQLALQLAAGLEAAHAEQVLHLDLKPANLMIDRNGNLKIADFGLARINTAGDEHTGYIAGTPGYMAPEQVLGESLTTRADIYAFGLILYEMTTGRMAIDARTLWERRAFHADAKEIIPPSTYASDISPALEKLIVDCLRPEASDRPDSMATVHERLLQITSGRQELVPQGDAVELDSSIEESDVYLCFAHVDDQSPSTQRSGWITQFQRNLQIRVEQLTGKQMRVCRAPRAKDERESDTQLLTELPTVKALVSVVSPPFINSMGCINEVKAFWEANERQGRLYVDGHTRVLKVVKTPVEDEAMPRELANKLQELLGFDFFEYDSQTGRLREYADWFGSEAEQRFHERIYDVAQEINALFRAMSKSADSSSEGKIVYLAQTSADIAPLQDRIRRELIGRGHRILPERPLPLLASEAESVIKACLAECDLSIHAFGNNYGVIPEGSSRSLAALQNELAAEYSRQTDLQRIIWIPSEVATTDPRQSELLDALKTNREFHWNAEIVVNTFQMLKPIVLEKLAPAEKLLAAPAQSLSQGPTRRIYLICDPQDEAAIEPLEDFFYEQGFDLILPDFEADEAQAEKTHRENLQDCDGVIIFYGAARNAWVDVKLRSILKVSGYGREGKLAFNAVYVAPPFDRRKERYRTHSAEIIRQSAEFDPSLLRPLTERLHQA